MKYVPIDCNFYDILESNAVLKKVVLVEYWNASGDLIETRSRIIDLFINEKVEYMKLENDTIIRLDFIKTVDGQLLQGSCAVSK